MATDVLQIKEIIERWVKAINSRDIPGVLASHSADILLYDVPEPLQARGIDVYRKSWVDMFFPWYGDNGSFALSELEITAGDNVAFCHGIIDCSGTENGELQHYKVRLTMGLKKDSAGWNIVHEHHSIAAK